MVCRKWGIRNHCIERWVAYFVRGRKQQRWRGVVLGMKSSMESPDCSFLIFGKTWQVSMKIQDVPCHPQVRILEISILWWIQAKGHNKDKKFLKVFSVLTIKGNRQQRHKPFNCLTAGVMDKFIPVLTFSLSDRIWQSELKPKSIRNLAL